MGAWGTGILSDDTVRDVIGDYLALFDRGNSPDAIRRKIVERYAGSLSDADEGPLIWFGIAKAQWDCSHLEPLVLSKIREIVKDGLGLSRWAEQGERPLERRKKAVAQFLVKLETLNSRARKPRKTIKRNPRFQPGDCIAVQLRDGDWGAILVLQGEPESDDPEEETYGKNLVINLRYKNSERPGLEVFEKREWLYWNHHSWKNRLSLCYVMALGFRTVKDRIVHIGRIPLRSTDPQTSKSYSPWSSVVEAMYVQDRWDRGFREV